MLLLVLLIYHLLVNEVHFYGYECVGMIFLFGLITTTGCLLPDSSQYGTTVANMAHIILLIQIVLKFIRIDGKLHVHKLYLILTMYAIFCLHIRIVCMYFWHTCTHTHTHTQFSMNFNVSCIVPQFCIQDTGFSVFFYMGLLKSLGLGQKWHSFYIYIYIYI